MKEEIERSLKEGRLEGLEQLPQEEWLHLIGKMEELLAEERRRYSELEQRLNSSTEEVVEMLESVRQQHEQKVEILLKALPDFVLIIDEEDRCLEFYDGGKALPVPGMQVDKLVGRRLVETLPLRLATEISALHRSATQQHKTMISELTLQDKEKTIDLEIRLQPLPEGEMGRGSAVVVLRETEPIARSEAPILQVLKRVVDDSKEGMFIASKNGDLLYHNQAFEQIFDGKEGGSLSDYREFFSQESYESLMKSIEQRGAYRGEVMIHRSDGSQLPVWLTLETIVDPGNNELYEFALFSNIMELQRSQVALQHSATHDALTGLPNRQALLSHLETTLQHAVRYRKRGAVIFIDLDNFKEINDSMGHLTGDTVLIETASRIRSVIRRSDIFGRLGGDEFLLIVEEISSPDALMHIANKIIDVVNRPIEIGNMNYTVGASLGITIFPHDSMDRDELLRYADMAMYRAKEKGKNRYQFYSRGIDEKVKKHFNIEKALRRALEDGGFYLVFQPQIDLSTDTVTGVEALLRLENLISSEKLMPEEFIPVAEESDIILAIGRWVFTRCCQVLYQWKRNHNLSFLQMSINLSRRQLIDEGWVDFVERTMRKYGVDPRQIEFEITETAFMHSGEKGLQVLRDLQKLGCRLAIDDFGTGYSSLSSLKEFTVDRLKIDRSFVQDITDNDTDRAIVKASIAMAQALGLKTVAEGVETSEQKKLMKLMGCREMQGFLYGKPAKADEVLRIILKSLSRKKKSLPF